MSILLWQCLNVYLFIATDGLKQLSLFHQRLAHGLDPLLGGPGLVGRKPKAVKRTL